MGLGVPLINNSIICLKQLLFLIRAIHKCGHIFFLLHKKVQETLVLSKHARESTLLFAKPGLPKSQFVEPGSNLPAQHLAHKFTTKQKACSPAACIKNQFIYSLAPARHLLSIKQHQLAEN